METGKIYAISILNLLLEANETEALDGNEKAAEYVEELQIALDWVKSK